MSWTISVIIICLLLLTFTIWLEYRRDNRSRLAWRIIAILIAVAALACIALPITYQGKAKISKDTDAVLLTEDYDTDSISTGYKIIFTIDKEIKRAYPKATLLTGIQDIPTAYPNVKQLHIVGYGLEKAELQQINIPVTYTPPAAPQNILAANWQQNLKAGDLLQVQGKFNNTSSKTVKLILRGLNTSLDSLNIPTGKITDFELTTTPKITGRAAYTLLALIGKDTIEKENIPVAVEPAKPVKVLMLSASPDFESKFLKNWLSQNGYVIAARATITKDKISQDFVNMEKQSLAQLSPALLNKFDVVVGDLSTLKALSAPESAALKQQVQNGLGIIIRADSSGKETSWLQNDFRVSTVSSKTLSVPLLLQGQKRKTLPINIEPSYISDRNNIQNLVFDPQNHILASSTLSGEGKLVFTTLHTTYTWVLAGSGKDYTALWSLLISKAARKTQPVSNWTTESAIAAVDEPVILQLQSSTAPGKLIMNHSIVGAEQNPFIAYEWNATYWPQNSGWQITKNGAGAPSWWYSYQKNSWAGIKNFKKITETKNYLDNVSKFQTVTKQIQQSASIEVPKMYFYLLLLASCTFLWVERKLNA
ncbi:MAG: hypothetical protein JWR67_3059 [Mucilaginibacter sp.]|nr:hypothetical protein [Mucilaginibacter sp.]